MNLRWMLAGALILAVCAWFAAQRILWWAVLLSGAMVLAGASSYAIHRMRLPEWDDRPPREARLTLRVDRTFPQSDAKKVTGLGRVKPSDAPWHELAGQRIYFSLALRKGEAAPLPTSEISTIGVLAALPKAPEPNSFESYLDDVGINFRLQRGRIVAAVRPPTLYARFCAAAVAQFRVILALGIESKRPELAALLRAMILGETHELSAEQQTLFRDSGTMHLFAISGMNIAVLAAALQAVLLQPLRRWPPVKFALGTALLWLFVDITGAAPSAVRAFAMAVFVQGALALWQPAGILAALVASALLVLVLAPLQFFSASFVMSYGIVATLLLLGLPLGETWIARWTPWAALPRVTRRWWQHKVSDAWRWTAAALAVGVSTTLVGLLTGVQYFGLLTPGSLVTNLALIPAAGVVTLSGFAALVFGLTGWNGGAIFCNHASAVALLCIERVVRLGVAVPGAFVPARFTVTWMGGVALAALGTSLMAGYALGWRRTAGGFWPPFVLVAAALIFGVKFG